MNNLPQIDIETPLKLCKCNHALKFRLILAATSSLFKEILQVRYYEIFYMSQFAYWQVNENWAQCKRKAVEREREIERYLQTGSNISVGIQIHRPILQKKVAKLYVGTKLDDQNKKNIPQLIT